MKWNKKKFAIKRGQRQACSSLPGVSKLCKTVWVATVGIILCGCLLFWPTSERACREGVAEAVTVSWYELGVPGGDTLYFNVLRTDSTLGGLSAERETAQREFRANAFFISYSGRLLTAADSVTRPERLNREKGGRFGDPKYAKEELVAELTAAMISHSMGFDSKVTDNSAAYLDSWIGALRKEPKFIVSVMADVNKVSDLILDHVDKQRLALGEQPYLAKNDSFTPLDAGEEVPFKNAAIVKTRSGDYAIRASYDGVELGLKKVSKDTAKTYFQLTDLKDKTAFLTMTAHKTYEPELAVMRRTQKTSVGLGL